MNESLYPSVQTEWEKESGRERESKGKESIRAWFKKHSSLHILSGNYRILHVSFYFYVPIFHFFIIHHYKNRLSSPDIFVHHCTFCASLHVKQTLEERCCEKGVEMPSLSLRDLLISPCVFEPFVWLCFYSFHRSPEPMHSMLEWGAWHISWKTSYWRTWSYWGNRGK